MTVKETRVMCYTPGCPDACWPRFLSLSVVQEVPPPAWLFSPSLSVSVSRPAVVVALSPPTTPPATGPKVKGQNNVRQTLSCLTSSFFNNPKHHNIFSSSNAAVPVSMTDLWQKRATFQQKQLVVKTNRWTELNRLLGRLMRHNVPVFLCAFHCLRVAVADSSSSQRSRPASAPVLRSDRTHSHHSDQSATVMWCVGSLENRSALTCASVLSL